MVNQSFDYKVVKYSDVYYSEWNTFVQNSKNGTFLFHRDFMGYHADRFEDFSLMVFKNDKLFAILPANKVENKLYSHQGLTYGSFCVLEGAKLLSQFEAFKKILEFLHNQNITVFEIKMIPSFYCTLPSDELAYFLFKSQATLIKRDAVMLIDYKHKLAFQKKRREGINKALRHNLTIKEEAVFDGFWNQILLKNLSQKHKVKPVHSLGEIRFLASRFPENIKQINVYYGEKIVAGTTLFLTKTTIHPQYVSADENKNKYGSLDFLYNYIINRYDTTKSYFDFNISSENNGNILNEGLIFWKESCGARTYAADTYSLRTDIYKTLEIKIK